MTPPPEFSEPRRSFVKKTLATSVSISFAGLIRAHGEEGGGTTLPETAGTNSASTVEETAGTTDSTSGSTTPETAGTTNATTQPPQTATEYETAEIVASSHAYKTITTTERKCHKIDQSEVTQWIEQDSVASISATVAIQGQEAGKWPPPPNQPAAPQGQGWTFVGWKENLTELQKAIEVSTGTVIVNPVVYWEGSTNSTTGTGLPDGYQWSSQVRKLRAARKLPYSATAIFRRVKPQS